MHPVLLIQEGGYIIERLGINLAAFLAGLTGAAHGEAELKGSQPCTTSPTRLRNETSAH